MKTLRKVSFENFNRMSITEASQLYGGTGDNPPTPTVPTDSTQVNKSDSIPPFKQSGTLSVTAKKEKDGSGTLNTTYEHQVSKKVTVTGGGSINTKGKWEVTAGIKIKIK